MKKQLLENGLIFLFISGLVSCKTFYFPLESFKAQFSEIDSTKLRTVYTKGPAGDIVEYRSAPIDYIKCVDKMNNPVELKNGPSIEIRFTEKNNRKTIFFFDRVFIQDTLIIGDRSRFLGLSKAISINNVKLIEIQDGHKNYKYVDVKKSTSNH